MLLGFGNMFVRQLTPFVNSIYEIQDLQVNLDLVNSKITDLLKQPELWYLRNHGLQTYNLIEILPEFEEIFTNLTPVAQEIINSWGINHTVKLKLYFINVDRRYSYSASHLHANCILSGVFYTKIPKQSGNIVFERPDSQETYFKLHNGSSNPYSDKTYSITPHDNMALLFPPYLKHRVDLSLIDDNDSRISIAFDYSVECMS
jgi:uncharacterized protein (TIGR02466 family)